MEEIFILGAGASYGSSFTDEEKPPIINNFFRKAFSIIGKEYDFFIQFLDKELGLTKDILVTGNVNFEELFSYIDANSRIETYGNSFANFPEFKIYPPLVYFESLIYDVILHYNYQTKNKSCKFHDKLAKYVIANKSCIISLNYDCIIDKSLLETTDWREEGGYGIFGANIHSSDEPFYNPTLFKIHGSINWSWAGTDVSSIHYMTLKDYFSRFRRHPSIGLLSSYKERNALKGYDKAPISFPKWGDPVLVFPTQFKDLKRMNIIINNYNLWITPYFQSVKKITIIGAYLLNDIHVMSWLTKLLKIYNRKIQIELVNPMNEMDLSTWKTKAKTFFPDAYSIIRKFNTMSEFSDNLK